MALSPELEADLKKLAFTVEMAEGEFRLVFAHCNYVLLQQQLADRLEELTGIVTLRLQPGERTLAEVLELLRRRGGSLPPGVQVLGMERMGDLPGGLAKLDQTRDQLQTQFPLPIVVWVNDDLQTAWKRYAPNLESWGAPKEFELDDETVAELIALKTKQLMERGWRLSTGEAEFLKLELAKAWARLEGKPLKDKTRAQLEALRGLTAEQLGDWLFGDPDFKHYQYALAYEGVWSTVESALLRRNSAWCGLRSGLAPEPAEIGSWIDGAQAGLMNSEHWQESLPGLALTAWKLRDWARLQGLVAGETSPVALTYQALLAWGQQRSEQTALALIEQAQAQWPEDGRPVERLLLIQLGGEIRAEQEDWQGLVNWLETAMEPLMALWTAPEPAFELPGALQPKQTAKDLFLGILEHCRETYFERLRDYRTAFTYSQTLTRVKKQMGDYAFIGAGRMEAATELEAAGRDQDVRALKERLLKPEHRLVVLYGQSGVGKSSLLQAGLAPALKSQALGQARLCPVYVRRYDGKLGELTTGLELPAGADWEAIIARAREWDRQERRLVLIFDQFEEFFFAFPQGEQQRRFFDGLAALLKEVLSAKVVLSLRKDYLHLLVDYPQIAPNAAGVLAADNLYELRDFTPEAATQLIERLTAKSNFAMSPLLIQTVVADLTREGKVRPIELQILGAQLQEQKRDIRGLSQYDAAGGKPQLLRDYVSQATRACGSANETLAGATLFLLTDEQERRLLKTRSELAEGLAQLGQRFEPSQLDLALDILGRSGLVVEIPEEPEARYQILHDYLVGLIRAQQEPLLAQLAAELEQEKAQRFEAEGRLAQVRSEIEAAQREREKLALKKSALEAEKGSLGDEIRDARRRLKNLFRMTLGMLGVATISGIFLPIAFTSHLNKRNYYESVLAAYEQELKKYTTSRKNTNGNSTLATEMAKVTREFIQAKTTYTLTVLSEDSSFLNLATIPILNKIDIFKDDNIRRRDSLLSYLRQMGLGFTSRLGYPPRNTDFFKDIEITNHSTGNLITLQNIDLGLSHFRDATFFRVNFDGGYFGYADLRGAYFSSSSLQNVIFSGADLTKATFIDVSLKKADFTRANLTGATGIALKTLQKQQAIICNTTMPDGQIVSLNCKPK